MKDMEYANHTQTQANQAQSAEQTEQMERTVSPAGMSESRAPGFGGNRRLMAAVLAGGLAVTVGAALWYGTRSGDSPPPPAQTLPAAPVAATPPVPSAPSRMLTVHVSGAVADPGLVSVAEGSRVADVIRAAGGMRPGAGFGSINLAETVRDGMRLAVPWAGEAPAGAGGDMGAGVSRDGKVDINRAGPSDMTRLPGVGEVIAQRIISYREANGPFGTVEDLLDVPGIGEGKLAAIRDYAMVG